MSNAWERELSVEATDSAKEYDNIIHELTAAKAECGGVGVQRYCRQFRLARGRPLIRKLDDLWKLMSPQEKQERGEWSP
jgi:hypothetical protein